MAPKELVHRQEGPWGLLGSEAADQPGSWVFPLRTAALHRALGLGLVGSEEVGAKTQEPLLLGAQPLDR